MNQDFILATVIHTDSDAGRFYVLKTPENDVIYSHWRVFQTAGITSVKPGQTFLIRTKLDEKDDQTKIVGEVQKDPDGQSDRSTDDSLANTEDKLSTEELQSEFANADEGLVIVRNKHIATSELEKVTLPTSIVFIDCCFDGDFRLLAFTIRGGIWFLNCKFKQHLSLRGTCLDGNAVLFGCDFTGPGGISFRGLRGRSIFLEYGTRGGEDMLWLNELSLTGCVALSGTFAAPVQLLAKQDEQPINDNPTLKRVLIGKKASYAHERLSQNQFLSGIECRDYYIQDSFEVHNSVISEVTMENVDAKYILVNNCEVSRDVVMERVQPRDKERGMAVTDTIIERRLRQTGPCFTGRLNLEGTSVGQTWTLELERPSQGVPHVILRRFHANAAWFEPIELVYGAAKHGRLLAPPNFGFLEGSRQIRALTGKARRELAEAYTSCKNWLAISGHLREEDHAFFHMREAKEHRRIIRILFGGIFGWGIYLRNIILSVMGLIILFALLFTAMGIGNLSEMLILSSQSFIGSFFGRWPDYSPTGILSVLITLESLFGVILVTALVGCYIRKLLR